MSKGDKAGWAVIVLAVLYFGGQVIRSLFF